MLGIPDEVASAEPMGWLHSAILGLVEGLTEFIPVSSTGHLIVANRFLGRTDPSYEIAIQAGAITAIVFLYWRQLWRAGADLLGRREAVGGGANLLLLIAVAAAPASALALVFEDQITALLFNPLTVAVALIVGGVGFLVVERWLAGRVAAGRHPDTDIGGMSVRQALVIGCWQVLALVPGTSRSGATIVGGLMAGCSRHAAAEFSFLVGLPVLYGACALKLWGDIDRLGGPMLADFAVGSLVAFVSAALVVTAFIRMLRRYTFRPFAWYRIAAGAVLLALFC